MKIGFVGGYGHECAKLYPEAEVAWALDGYDEAAAKRAAAFDCRKIYASMDVMLLEFRPDVVSIGSVYGMNGRLAVEAMERGFDVVSEKPLATDRTTLERLRSLTCNGERRIVAEFAMRWNAVFQRARELIRSGAIGAPVMIQAQKTYKFGAQRPDFYKSREQFGGIIPWVAVHAIDYAAWCTGLRYESVTALHGNRCHPDYPEMEDHAAMLFQMSGGVPCAITADFLRPEAAGTHGDDRLRVTGESGVVEICHNSLTLINAEGTQQWELESDMAHAVQRAVDLVNAALGTGGGVISTAECLHITAAALCAREAADDPDERRHAISST